MNSSSIYLNYLNSSFHLYSSSQANSESTIRDQETYGTTKLLVNTCKLLQSFVIQNYSKAIFIFLKIVDYVNRDM